MMKTNITADVVPYETIIKRSEHAINWSNDIVLYDNIRTSQPVTDIFTSDILIKTSYNIVIICISGKCKITVNKEDVSIQKNEVLMISPNSTIQVKSCTSEFKYAAMHLSSEICKRSFVSMDIMQSIADLSYTYKKVNSEKKSEISFVNLYNGLFNTISASKDILYAREIIFNLLQIIGVALINTFDLLSFDESDCTSRQYQIYLRFLELLNKNFKVEREVQYYAKKLKITPKYLSSISVQYSGRNASAWIEEYVVTYAKELMRENTDNIKGISEALNFKSQSFFGRYFKRVTGVAPKRFMMQELKKTISKKNIK